MKRIQLILILLCGLTNIFAQKQVYFESEQEKNISISSYKGIEMSLGSVVNISGINGCFTLGYFTESLLTKSSSVIWGVKSINTIYKSYLRPNDFTTFKSNYGLQLALFAEPRWYFNYKKRVLHSKSSDLNSAWFVSLPFELSSSYLLTNMPISLNLTVPISIGFRGTFNRNVFWECKGGFGIYSDFTTITPVPDLKFKVGYVF